MIAEKAVGAVLWMQIEGTEVGENQEGWGASDLSKWKDPEVIVSQETESAAMRAAEYVRMSTEHQKYSTENQSDAIREYAERHGMEIVRRLLQLAWLAPDIMEAILDGKQPAGLTLEPFRADQPVAWQAQRALLGFNTR